MSQRHIQYAVNVDDGMVISRVGSDLAWPVLDYKGIGQGGGGFQKGNYNGPMRYSLEKFNVHSVGREWGLLKWTKKIPRSIKNRHRKFWGMKPLKGPLHRWERRVREQRKA